MKPIPSIVYLCFQACVKMKPFLFFWLGVLCEQFLLLIMLLLIVQMFVTPYVGFTDGASRNTCNLSSVAWVIYNPDGELIDLQGIRLG